MDSSGIDNDPAGAAQALQPDERDSADEAPNTREKIIQEYGALMERTPPLPTRIKGRVRTFRIPEAILDALLQEIVRRHPQHISDAMRAGAISLAQYQLGVGNDPLEMLGVDVGKLQLPNERELEAYGRKRNSSPEQRAKRGSGSTSPTSW